MIQNEIDLTIKASEKIDREIARLHQKRARVRGKLNEYLSAARNLPQEVLTEIFRLSACRLNLREPQLYSIKIQMLLRLGSICSNWRSIIWSASSLWTTCLLEQDDPVPPLIVALVFSNAGSGCVSIEVDLNKMPHESLLLIFNITERRFEPLEFNYLIITPCAVDGINWHLIFPSPQNGQTSQSCGCFHRIRRSCLV